MFRRFFILLAGLALVAAACGGADEATTEAPGDGGSDLPPATQDSPQLTGTPAPADTGPPPPTGPPVVSTGDFCADTEANDALIDGVDFFSDDIEAAVEQWLAAIDAAEAAAPPEIADDVAVIAAGARDFVALLQEANFNPLEIDPTDPRLAALEDGSLDQAADNIAAYCGFEIDMGDAEDSGVGAGSSTEFGTDPLPAYMTEDLVVPELIGVDDNGAAGLDLGTSLSFDNTVAYYEGLFGVAGVSDGGDVVINAQYDGATWFVLIQEIDAAQTLVTLLRL